MRLVVPGAVLVLAAVAGLLWIGETRRDLCPAGDPPALGWADLDPHVRARAGERYCALPGSSRAGQQEIPID